MSTKPTNNEDEVDLGSLFVIIGKGFSNLFNFIATIFKELFHVLISLLLFIKKHLLKIGIAALIGGVLGGFLEYNKGKRFGADMLVQPNFKSAHQLYNNIQYYNDLVKQKDTLLLSKTFNISVNDAQSLKKFSISPIITENDILSSYDDLILSVDTLTAKSYSFDKFKRMFTPFDYKIHDITVESTKNNVFHKLDETIISSITKNDYFNKVKELTNENLNRTDALLRRNLQQTDSLFSLYKEVMLEEAKKQHQGTNIDLGGTKTTTKELQLFETNRRLNKDLKEISEDKSEKSEVLNVVSNFQPIGYEIKEIQKNYIFQFALAGAFLMIAFLLLLQLNNYLSTYKK